MLNSLINYLNSTLLSDYKFLVNSPTMSCSDFRRISSISEEELRNNMKIIKMKSESDISSFNIDAVKSIRPRTKSLTLDLGNDSNSSDKSKKLQDSDSLSLKLSSSSNQDSDEVTKNLKGKNQCTTSNGSLVDTQSDTILFDPDDDGGPHNLSPSTSDTVLLDYNENESKMDKVMHEHEKIFRTSPSNDGMDKSCPTLLGKNLEVNDVANSRDVSQLHFRGNQVTKVSKVHEKPSLTKTIPRAPDYLVPAIIKSPEKTFVPETQSPEKPFVPETQSQEKSPEEIPKSPDPPAKRRRKKVSQLDSVEKGECPLCGRIMKTKVLVEHAAICNGSDRSQLTRLALLDLGLPIYICTCAICRGSERRQKI